MMVPLRWQPFVQLILARVREFYREPEVIFWVYGFPLILAIGLGIAFASRKPDPPTVDIAQSASRPTKHERAVRKSLREGKLQAEIYPADQCRKRLKTGKTALAI